MLETIPVEEMLFIIKSIKRELKIKPIYECRCNGRLQTKRFTHLSHTGRSVGAMKD